MLATSVGAIFARPTAKQIGDENTISLETMIPKHFGEWQEETKRYVQVVNPQTQELLDKIYSQVLSRTYINSRGYRVMLSLAYGTDQRGALQAHKPEVCYPAQGFIVQSMQSALLGTAYGEIPVQRLYTTLGARHEPLTYWFTVGDRAVKSQLQKRLTDVSFGLTGRIPDGMLFRVSSIDSDKARAYNMQDQFINDLLQNVSPAERKRLSGLGDS
jgi:EpsI family protein